MARMMEYLSGKKYLILLYTILITIFSLIIQIGVIRPFLYVHLGILDYLIVVVMSISYLILFNKEVKVEKIATALMVIGGTAITIVHGGEYILRYLLLVVLHVGILTLSKCEDISSEEIKSKGNIMVIGILVSAVGFLDGNLKYGFFVGQLSILFFVQYVILLRASRNFYHKLNKKNIKLKVLYVVFMMACLVKDTQRLVSKVVWFVLMVLDKIAVKVIEILSRIIGPILVRIKILPKAKVEDLFKPQNIDESMNGLREKSMENGSGINVYLLRGIELAICILLIFIVYKLIKRFLEGYKGKALQNGVKIEREFIVNKDKNKFKNKFREKKPVTVKEKILYSYREFLMKAKKKNLYKEYMTGRQVQSRVGAEIYNRHQELNVMTAIYNEAKFSGHHINEDKLKTFEENYSKVKKEM